MKVNRRFQKVVAVVFLMLFVLAVNPLFAEEEGGKGAVEVAGIVLSIVGGLVQLIIGLALAVTSISIGLRLLGKILPDLNVIDELKKKNRAIGAVTAGVVIAYTKVISRGITSIGESISISPSISGFIAGLINVVLGVLLASLGIMWAYRAINKVTPGIDLLKGLKEDNLGVGLFMAGLLFAISEMIASGVSGIGQAISSALGALF